MNELTLSNEIALRIALAARELPDTDAVRLLKVLNDSVGLPPTKKSLMTLTVKMLRSSAEAEFSEMDNKSLKSALACLKGEVAMSSEPLPETVAYAEGDLPGSIRIACASNKGELVDGHFGSCQRFLIYQATQTELRLIDIREIDDSGAGKDKNGYRASLIADCELLFLASIGGPAAAKVVRAGVHPIKMPQVRSSIAVINELQHVIGEHAPPWLAKVMGKSPEERIRFEQDEMTTLEAEA